MRTIGLALVALFSFWAAAQAQIAAPRLNPLPSTPFSSWNPAVYSWDGPSRVGGAGASTSMDFTASGSSEVEAATGDGKAAVFAFVGESFAFGAYISTLDLEINQTFGGGPITFESAGVGVSFQINDLFSIGVGQETGRTLFDTDLDSTTLPIVGGTLRLGDAFYVGLAYGSETLSNETTDVAGSTQEGDRTVTRIGVAYHMRDGENGLHVEAWLDNVDTLESGSFTRGTEETTGIALEAIFSNILFGFESTSGEDTEFVTGAVQQEIEATTISVGWAPMEGLSVVVSISEMERTDLTNGDLFVFNATTAGVTWAF